jgi:single-stranded DNA-binding protein
VLSALATGTLVSDPKQRTGAGGRLYVTATLRVATEDDSILVMTIAFNSTAQRALMSLSKGDTAAVTGRAKLTSWDKDGETRHGLSVVAEQVMTHYQLERRRARATGKPAEPEAKRVSSAQAAGALALRDTSSRVAGMADDLGPWGGS